MRNAAFVLLLLAAAIQSAHGADWKMNLPASKLEFVASFEKTAAPGVFKDFDARIRFDAGKPEGGQIDVTIRTASADMSSADINKAIGGPEWFDFARYPQAVFQAAEIRRVDASHFVARGTLTLKGVRQAAEVPFVWTNAADAATMEGELTLQRAAFGIGTGEWSATNVIGADVKVRFKLKLRKAG
jgi:polyisoprenoid-binding protein YceI